MYKCCKCDGFVAELGELEPSNPCVCTENKIKHLERQLEEARELLLKIQDHMSQLSTHTHDGWSGSCADTVYEMIEEQLKERV